MEYITELPISPGDMFDKLQKDKSGSVLLHYGVVKMHVEDQVTSGIQFDKIGDAESEIAALAAEICNKWGLNDILLVRRVGTLKVGDIISLVAVSSARSKDAFEACRYGVEHLKKMVSLKKRELFLNQDTT
ncbi:MAG: molybdenum cofactor biosynthesis protein MoaE [Syntrophales bacterium]